MQLSKKITEIRRVLQRANESDGDGSTLIADLRTALARALKMLTDDSADTPTEQQVAIRDLVRGLEQARTTENTALARELHDGIGQGLTAASLELQILGIERGGPIESQHLSDALEAVERAAASIAELFRALRSHDAADGVGTMIHGHIENLRRRAGTRATLHVQPPEMIVPAEYHAVLSAVVGHVLGTVTKPADLGRVHVACGADDRALRLSIEDGGQASASTPSDGPELEVMRSCIEAVGGTLTVSGSAGSRRVQVDLAVAVQLGNAIGKPDSSRRSH